MIEHLRFVESLSPELVGQLCELYQAEWWTTGRRRGDIDQMLANSDVTLGLVDSESGKLVGFARGLSDGVYKALIFDVIVAAPFRGHSLGRTLVTAILDHPRVRAARHKELYCRPEVAPFYRQCGFTDDMGELRLMRRTDDRPR